ncbi:APC family permease [Streptomyces sp. NPDC090075]|uniref:APC family permease n=1 Tax=Streptomyces sp. NPDC090075 TaxID=3365937 RepID=UPI003811D087
MTLKQATADPPQDASHLRADSIGTAHLVFFVIAAAAPLTIIAGFAPLAFLLGGEATPMGFLVPGLVYLFFAVGYTAMSRHIPDAGAFYAYISHGFGRVVGAGAAVMAYVGYLGGQIGFTASAGLFASTTLDDFFGVKPSWLVCALVITVGAGVLGYNRVDIGARVLAGLLIAEIAVLAVFCVAVLAQNGHEGLSFGSFSPHTFLTTSLASVFVLTFISYVGFEQTAIYSEEARDRRRTVSRATYIAVSFLALAYTFCAWVVYMAAGPERIGELLRGDPSTLVFALNDEFAGSVMTKAMQALIVTSFIAGVLALQNACGRYLLVLGRDGIAPRAFGRVNPRTQAPGFAAVVQTGLVLVALVVFGFTPADPYTQIVVWTNTPTLLAVLALQIATSAAVIRFFGKAAHRGAESVWHARFAPALAALALTGALWLTVDRMHLITGIQGAQNLWLILPLPMAFAIGALRAFRIRAARPAQHHVEPA